MRTSKYPKFRYPACFGMALFAALAAAPSHAASPPACTVAPVAPSQPNGLPGRLQRLEDSKAIEELKAAYGYALDAATRDP